MKYEIIANTDVTIFEETVNEFLANGWKLQGGISTVSRKKAYTHEILHLQAMTKTT